jgi:energy-coupling factor transporter ATP-binding protein EcfA2
MGYYFNLNNDWFGKNKFKISFYKRTSVMIKPGLTVLVGCNGIGKTTFLQQLECDLKEKKEKYIFYNNLLDGGHNARQAALDRGNIEFLATAAISSEGENINLNICNLARNIGYLIRKKLESNDKKVFILLDAVDSGLSIDYIIDIKENLFNFVIKDCKEKGIDIYFVVSANSYEMARDSNCFDVYEGKYKKFKDYEEYREFILERRKIKEKRYSDEID